MKRPPIAPRPVIHRVWRWRASRPSESRYERFRDAKDEGIITEAEYEAVKRHYGGYTDDGGLWNYVGD